MTEPGDSFVAEDFLRLKRGDVALWATASVMVICGIAGGVWAYQTYVPRSEPAGPPAGAIVVEFAEFAQSPATEELDIAEGAPSLASVAAPPSELPPDPEVEPVEEPQPVLEEPPEEIVEPEPLPEREETVEDVEATTPEPLVESDPEPVTEATSEPVEPIIDVSEVEVPEPAVVVPRRMAAVFPPIPEPKPEPPEEPEPEPEPEPEQVEAPDPNLPMPVTMSQRVAEVRAETPPTDFTPPPPRRTAPPEQQASSETSAPEPAQQQAEQTAAPQQVQTAAPSASEIQSWKNSVSRHLARRQRNPNDGRRGEGGDVVLRFSIDASGRVLQVKLDQSSGVAAIDQAAIDLAWSSSPVPAPPAGQEKDPIVIPLSYAGSR